MTIGQYPLLFFSQASIWHQVILVSWLTLKLSLPHNMVAMIISVSSDDNISVILLWTSWLNIQTIYFGLYLFQSVVTVMQLAITINVFIFKYIYIKKFNICIKIYFNVFDPMSGWDKHRMVVDLDRFTVCT